MSNSAWCELNGKIDILKLHDLCHNPKCKCQKQFIFKPKQYLLEGGGFKITMKKIFARTEKIWNSFIRPGLNIASPFTSVGVLAKTKNPQAG